MNFLAHLYLSGDSPELLVGNLMGDFVKGRLKGNFAPGIEKGILLHRAIDSFAGRNPHFLQSKRRLDQRFGLYRGVLVDLFYDHFLAAHWEDYADKSLPDSITDARRILRRHREVLPGRLLRVMPSMFEEWLPSYREIGGIAAALGRMSQFRIKRANHLAEGVDELRRHYNELDADFVEFFPEMMEFSADWLEDFKKVKGAIAA